MELADAKSIAAMLQSARTVYTRRKIGLPATSARLRPRKRCSCGTCPSCRDDARWNRIFQEKFADPEYYNRRNVNCSSSLAGL